MYCDLGFTTRQQAIPFAVLGTLFLFLAVSVANYFKYLF